MKNYFSQLARHTGLRFAGAAQRSNAVAPVAPLHVEEVRMVSPAIPSADAATGDEPVAARTTVAEKIETVQSKVEQLRAQEIQTTPVSQEPPRAEIESLNSFESVSVEKPITLAADNTDIKTDLDVSERVEVKTVEVPVPAEPGPAEPHATNEESSEVEFANPVEREVLVRQYLREVREWVAASPMPDQSVSESLSLTDQKQESVAFTVERESIPTIQPEPRDQIDVHDMNLSIGNISIVIEEPSPAAAAVIAPPPTPPPAQPQTRHEPTSLSRYYLRSW